jgi:hypothetical protein
MPAELPPGDGLVPQTPIVAKRTYAAPMSYIGSSRRIWSWTRSWGGRNVVLGILAFFVLTSAVLLAWAVVTVWYFVVVLLFSWLLIPYRLIRRSHRKHEHLQRQQLATMQAMLVNQQRALREGESPE